MSLLQRLRIGLSAALSSDETSALQVTPDAKEEEVQPVKAQPGTSELELTVLELKKKVDWFYSRILSILNERDLWKNRFFEEVAGHQTAQGLYEASLARERQWLVNAVNIINSYRAKDGGPAMTLPFQELWDPPIGENDRYRQLVEKLIDGAPKWVDHLRDLASFVGNHARPDGTIHTGLCINRWALEKKCSCLGAGM